MFRPSDSPPVSPNSPQISDEDDHTEAPLTMEASTMLTTLPVDTKVALATAGSIVGKEGVRTDEKGDAKILIHLDPISNAPRLKNLVLWMTASNRFEVVVRQIRKKLNLEPHQSLVCYIGNVFSPALDETVENLWRCFKQGDKRELYIGYAMSPMYG